MRIFRYVSFCNRTQVGITTGSIAKLEKAEADEKITLASLRKLASALDCDLQHTLAPRKSSEEILGEHAMAITKERLTTIHDLVQSICKDVDRYQY